jgi:hypothetical protein
MSKSDEEKLAALIKKNAAKAAKKKKTTRRQYDDTLPADTDDDTELRGFFGKASLTCQVPMVLAGRPRRATCPRWCSVGSGIPPSDLRTPGWLFTWRASTIRSTPSCPA